MRDVTIEWEGPFTIEEVLTMNDQHDDYGLLYQIYGKHRIFGENSLLYIGRAQYTTLGARLKQHFTKWLDEEEGVWIRIGRIADEDYEDKPSDCPDWSELLTNVEALQIYWHSPPQNSTNISTYNGPPLYVVNKGNRGDLVAEYRYDGPAHNIGERNKKRDKWIVGFIPSILGTGAAIRKARYKLMVEMDKAMDIAEKENQVQAFDSSMSEFVSESGYQVFRHPGVHDDGYGGLECYIYRDVIVWYPPIFHSWSTVVGIGGVRHHPSLLDLSEITAFIDTLHDAGVISNENQSPLTGRLTIQNVSEGSCFTLTSDPAVEQYMSLSDEADLLKREIEMIVRQLREIEMIEQELQVSEPSGKRLAVHEQGILKAATLTRLQLTMEDLVLKSVGGSNIIPIFRNVPLTVNSPMENFIEYERHKSSLGCEFVSKPGYPVFLISEDDSEAELTDPVYYRYRGELVAESNFYHDRWSTLIEIGGVDHDLSFNDLFGVTAFIDALHDVDVISDSDEN